VDSSFEDPIEQVFFPLEENDNGIGNNDDIR